MDSLYEPQFSFIVPEDGKYYLTWQTEHSDGDRSLAWNFNLTTSPISASTLSTFANGALSSLEELTLSGEFTKEDFEILSAKIGKNQVLTHVDLTQANIAEDARDIFNESILTRLIFCRKSHSSKELDQ